MAGASSRAWQQPIHHARERQEGHRRLFGQFHTSAHLDVCQIRRRYIFSSCALRRQSFTGSPARSPASHPSPLPLLIVSLSLSLQSSDPLHDAAYRKEFLHVDGTITEAVLKLLQKNNPMGSGVRVCVCERERERERESFIRNYSP